MERYRITYAIITTKNRETGEAVERWEARLYDKFIEKVNKRAKTIKLEAKVTETRGKGRSKAEEEAKDKLKKFMVEGTAPKGLGDDPLVSDWLLAHWTRTDKPADGRKPMRKDSRSVTYLKNQRGMAVKYWTPALGTMRMSQLRDETIDGIMKRWYADGATGNQVNRRLKVLRTAVSAWADKKKKADPLQYLDPADAEPTKDRGTLSLSEINKVIDLPEQSPRLKAAILLGALCGLRMGECRGLQWADVDFDNNRVNIKNNWVCDSEGLKAPKYGSVRTVPLPAEVRAVLEILRELPPASPFVLANERHPGKAVSVTLFVDGFPKILERIGISESERKERNLVYHGLRHAFISHCRAGGVPGYVVQAMAGHSSLEMTDDYSHGDETIIDFEKYRLQMETALAAGGEK
ncbi:MAG: hypothetical protein A2001_11125 [Treponema sp. GWC1_61_84]|nr:MAG: hypothetical protein A2001_11125 [Treponema sp. GWC1_61_84]